MSSSKARLGFYYLPDNRHYTQLDLNTWLPVLKSLGAHWLTLQASHERSIPEAFIRGLMDEQIEPIIHIPCRLGAVTSSDLKPLLNSYARWGINYVVVYDRPNQRESWDASDWCRSGLVERFVDHLLPILEIQQSAGLKPVLPPLEPGGDYWDTAFLEAVLESLSRRGYSSIQKLTLSIYAWTYGKPIDWGAGGRSSWPEARPYRTPSGCQDQMGFRIFDWYTEIAENIVHSPLPILVIAGGDLTSRQVPELGSDHHAEKNLSIARALVSGEVPNNVINFAFYHLASAPDLADIQAAWFPSIDRPLPAVAMIQRLANQTIKQTSPEEGKPLQHYVLLPPSSDPHYAQNWKALGPFVLAVQPVVGFSPQEARFAKFVTLFGDVQTISSSIEEELRAAGCNVKRFTEEMHPELQSCRGPSVTTAQPAVHYSHAGDRNE